MTAKITIERLQPAHVDSAKRLLRTVWHEFFGDEPDSAVRDYFDNPGTLSDLDDAHRVYFDDGGIFLLVLDEGRVVGTGAVKCLDTETCELRRMFLLRDYRGRGLGTQLAGRLLEFARSVGYRRARLATNKKLHASHRLYARLGFHNIPPYGDEITELAYYMEKVL